MKRKHLIAAATVIALGAGGAGAIAATSNDKAAETAVLSSAAKQLGVSATELRSALSAAENEQLAAQVKAGTITQAQADAIKQHRADEGTVLDVGGPGDHGGFGHHGGPGFELADAAKAIGISEDKLMTQLKGGKTLEQVATANGTTLAAVKTAVKQAATDRLDADLKSGDITKAQHDEQLSHLDDMLTHLGDFGKFGDHDGDGPHGQFGPPPTATATP